MKWYIWVLVSIVIIVILLFATIFTIRTIINVSIVKKETMTKEQLLKLSDADLVMVILFHTDFRYGDVTENYALIESISDYERIAYTVAIFDLEVQNGGICQYFANPSGCTARYISKALEDIGAQKISKAFTEFTTKYDIDINNLEEFKWNSTEEFSSKYTLYPFEEFDNTFVSTYKVENLEELNARFIRDHIDKFDYLSKSE